MTKQIDELMALADEYAKAWHASQTSRLIAAYDDGDHRKALRQALEAALKPGEPVQLGNEWTPCVKLPITVHVRSQREGEKHISTREGITPVQPDDLIMRGVAGEEYPIGRELFERTYRIGAAPPAQTPMQKMHTPPGMADPLDVVYAEGWNAACEKFGNPVFEPTPALVVEVMKEVARPAQTPLRLTDESILSTDFVFGESDSEVIRFARAIETAVRKQAGWE